MLFQCWPTVFDAGPTLKQHRVNTPSLLGIYIMYRRWLVQKLRSLHYKALGHYIRRWPNIDLWLCWQYDYNELAISRPSTCICGFLFIWLDYTTVLLRWRHAKLWLLPCRSAETTDNRRAIQVSNNRCQWRHLIERKQQLPRWPFFQVGSSKHSPPTLEKLYKRLLPVNTKHFDKFYTELDQRRSIGPMLYKLYRYLLCLLSYN